MIQFSKMAPAEPPKSPEEEELVVKGTWLSFVEVWPIPVAKAWANQDG